MKNIYQSIFVLAFLSSIIIFNPVSYAAEGLKLGDAEFIPWAEVTVQYDDNVFLDSSDEKDDVIVTLTPGVSLEWPFQDNKLKLDYHTDIIEFLDYTSQDSTNHYVSGNLEIELRDVTFNIYDDFKRVFERPSTEDTSRVKRDDNTAGITAKMQKERLGIQLGYEHFIRNYRSDAIYEKYDRTEDIYSLLLTHKTFSKTELLLEYDFAQIEYDTSTHSDSDYNQILVGAIGELTPKTTATIKTGYMARDYEEGNETDFDSGVLYADITHKFSDTNALKLSLLRSAEESTYGSNNYYKIENVSAVFDHYFTTKLLGFINGSYQLNSYPIETTEGTETRSRKDEYASLGAGFRYYAEKWLTLTLKAEHIDRDSNFEIFDYEHNLVTLSAKAIF